MPTPAPNMSERAARPERLIALFVVVLWAAVAFAVDGFVALAIDRDPIESEVGGPFYVILAFAVTGLVLWVVLAGISRAPHPTWGVLAAGAGAYLSFVGLGAIWSLPLAVEQATSPFVLAATVLAGVTVVPTWAVLRPRRPRTGPPDLERIT